MSVSIKFAAERLHKGFPDGSPVFTGQGNIGTVGSLYAAEIQIGGKGNGFAGKRIYFNSFRRTVDNRSKTGQFFRCINFKRGFFRIIP